MKTRRTDPAREPEVFPRWFCWAWWIAAALYLIGATAHFILQWKMLELQHHKLIHL